MTEGTLPTPPELPGRAWRSLQPSDARAMRALDLSGSAPGGLAADPLQDYDNAFDDARTDPAADTLTAVDERGALLAYGWVQAPRQLDNEYRVDLLWQAARAGARAPGKPLAKRTVVATPAAIAADFLLDWMEARARQRCAELPDDGLPRRLALWCWADQRPRLALYERHGYTERWAQQHMRRNLRRPRPAVPFPDGIKIVPWELEHDELMRQAYDSAFRDQRQRDDGGIDTKTGSASTPTWRSSVPRFRSSPCTATCRWGSHVAFCTRLRRRARSGSSAWCRSGGGADWEQPCSPPPSSASSSSVSAGLRSASTFTTSRR